MNRAHHLKKRFQEIIDGTVNIDQHNARLFLEGLCAYDDPVACVNSIVKSTHGLSSIRAVMHLDLSSQFMNGLGSKALAYLLRAGDIGGDALHSVLLSIVDPPILWSALTLAFEKGELNDASQLAFTGTLLYLLSIPDQDITPYRDIATRTSVLNKLLGSSNYELREMGYKLKHVLFMHASGASFTGFDGPGGRHDNDFVDFRKITLLPTADELLSKRAPFIRPLFFLEDRDSAETRVDDYLDNTFRLLREDVMYELRDEVQIVLQKKKGKHRGLRIDGLSMAGVYTGSKDRRTPWGLILECAEDFRQLKGVEEKDRLTFLTKDYRGSKILKHQSLACLVANKQILSFGTIQRVEDLLARNPPRIVLQPHGDSGTQKTLTHFNTSKHVQLVQIDTAFFAFEPVLGALKKMKNVPLCEEILFWESDMLPEPAPEQITRVIQPIESNPAVDLKRVLGTSKSISLDRSQSMSMIAGLKQRVSLIQGPPGTGKSFIGALLAKAIHDFSSQKILVVCHTNHALDQFLNDLIEIGIPVSHLVRLGGSPSESTECLSLQKQPRGHLGRSSDEWQHIDDLKFSSECSVRELEESFKDLINTNSSGGVRNMLSYVRDKYSDYHEAFVVPEEEDGMTRVGRNGQAVGEEYLISRWIRGEDAGIYKDDRCVCEKAHIWTMDDRSRQEMVSKWKSELERAKIDEILEIGRDYNAYQDELKRTYGTSTAAILKEKRIIGCTTTGAAIYAGTIKDAGPDVLLVEEAGEILESHLITALGSSIQQMILIGDHKQLRPKVNNYQLTVEKGEGYDLNRSLFERLVLQGFPHGTLSSQHRMRPEISAFVRELTYPELVDAPSTLNRPDIRGVQSNVIFVDHRHPEDDDMRIGDRADVGSSTSKQNTYEVEMVLKIVRYLAQQGYQSDSIVVLTPYLGQLLKIRDALADENDPILNDMDSDNILRAGLSIEAKTKKAKKGPRSRLRLATIDNYQGEESEIVIASLTRSNQSNAIGFMNSPERLNVLLSRARNGLILIGNSDTFLHSKQGGALWGRFLKLLGNGQYVYQGFPVKCERHPQRKLDLKFPAEFDNYSPDGGCTEPCGVLLNCGIHPCPKKCHPPCTAANQGDVHLTMSCMHRIRGKCDAGHHELSWNCHQGRPSTCPICAEETKRLEEHAKRDLEAQQERARSQHEHELRMKELEAKLKTEEKERQALQTRPADGICPAAGSNRPGRQQKQDNGGASGAAASSQDCGVQKRDAVKTEAPGMEESQAQNLNSAKQNRKRHDRQEVKAAPQRKETITDVRPKKQPEEAVRNAKEERKRHREEILKVAALRQAQEERMKEETRREELRKHEEQQERKRHREEILRVAALRQAQEERIREETRREELRKIEEQEERKRHRKQILKVTALRQAQEERRSEDARAKEDRRREEDRVKDERKRRHEKVLRVVAERQAQEARAEQQLRQEERQEKEHKRQRVLRANALKRLKHVHEERRHQRM